MKGDGFPVKNLLLENGFEEIYQVLGLALLARILSHRLADHPGLLAFKPLFLVIPIANVNGRVAGPDGFHHIIHPALKFEFACMPPVQCGFIFSRDKCKPDKILFIHTGGH